MKVIPFEIADKLCDQIYQFLIECGGPYKRINGETQRNILVALASRQFVLKIRFGEIRYFACWYRIKAEDLESMKERVRPIDVFTGNVMYVAECGNKDGRKGIIEMVKKIRNAAEGMQGVFWHRPEKEDKVFDFPSQKGKGV